MHGMVHVFQTCLNNVNNYITYRNNDNVFCLVYIYDDDC